MGSKEVGALKVADEAFLVATTIERCPKTMMIRELFMNSVEAASRTAAGPAQIEFSITEIAGVPKLTLWNSGPGMSSVELHQICDIASSIGKEKSLDENFGMGAKVASLPSNRLGLRYRSCKAGVVSEVVLCERDGVYGRLRREVAPGIVDEVIDVTDSAVKDGRDTSTEWTEVVLLGNHATQNTVRDPYFGDPIVKGQWLADYLYHRFYRIPEKIAVRFREGTHKLDNSRVFKTIPVRAYPLGEHETVSTSNGIRLHYFYDPPLAGSSHNASISGALTTDVSTCAIVFKDEMYDVKRSKQWTLDAPIFGVTFGAKHISVHIELPDTAAVRPEAYRQFLRYRDGDQRQVLVSDFADLVRENRPRWLVDLISALSPIDLDPTSDIRRDLQKLLDQLRIKAIGPRITGAGAIPAELGDGKGAGPNRDRDEVAREGKTARVTAEDVLAVPEGTKRAVLALNTERVPDIIPLHDAAEVEAKGFAGKAAKYYAEPSQLFVNMRYPSVDQMRGLLESEYAAAADVDAMRQMATDFAEKTIMIRVGRAVVFGLAKRLNREWTVEDTARAQSPESLSLAADDFFDAMQNARRKMGQTLRLSRKDAQAETEVA